MLTTPEQIAEGKGLGRIRQPEDPRDYPVSISPRKMAAVPDYRYWIPGAVLDQGDTPQCVEYSGRTTLLCSPVKQNPPDPFGSIYNWCQNNDEWPGTDYEGTSVRALMKWLKANGYISSYEWATNVDQMHAHIATRGPAVVGTDWWLDMFMPDRHGYIRPGNYVVGGHAYCIRGSNRRRVDPGIRKPVGAFRKRGTWGVNWADHGEAWISFPDMQRLIDADGEIALPVEIKRIPL